MKRSLVSVLGSPVSLRFCDERVAAENEKPARGLGLTFKSFEAQSPWGLSLPLSAAGAADST